MMRRLMVLFLIGAVCLMGTIPVLAEVTELKVYPTLDKYQEITGKTIDKFSEASMLKTQVAAGEIPSVKERLPEQPLVIDPLDEIGEYGGTIHGFTEWSAVASSGGASGMVQMPLHWSPDHKRIIPNIFKDWTLSKDRKTLTVYLREGMKWSDGHPFTTEDIIFWWEDITLNDKLVPNVPKAWCPGGEPMKVEKIDDYTLRFRFSVPYPAIVAVLTSWEILWGEEFPIQPKHYLKKFHAKYNPNANELAKENGFDSWFQYLLHQADSNWGGAKRVGLPSIGPYKLVERTSDSLTFERNPYYWKIDTQGNQLPYIDRVVVRKVENPELVTGKLISGEMDIGTQETSLQNYPLYKENAQKGGYRVLLWKSAFGSQVNLHFNHTYKEDPVLGKLFRDARFRQALSLAIDREEMNEALYFGEGTPRQFTVGPSSRFFEPRFAEAYSQYDLGRANKLLDEIGLRWNQNHGYRLKSDGTKLAWTVEFVASQQGMDSALELVKDYWEEIGVQIMLKPIAGELMGMRAPANKMAMNTWKGDKTADPYFLTGDIWQFAPVSNEQEMYFGPEWARWYMSDGEAGEEPPEEIKKLYKWRDQMVSTLDEQERTQLGKKILASQAENIWQIGTVGLVPHPIIVNDQLRNVPERYLYAISYGCLRDSCPETYFFKQE